MCLAVRGSALGICHFSAVLTAGAHNDCSEKAVVVRAPFCGLVTVRLKAVFEKAAV